MNWIFSHIERLSEKEFLSDVNNTYTYLELSKQILSYSKDINSFGINHGEIVAISSDYSFYSIALLLSLSKNKNIIVPLITSNESELHQKLIISSASVVVRINSGKLEFEKIVNNEIIKSTTDQNGLIQRVIDSNESGLILFSSGSTGTPKAMIHSFEVFFDAVKNKKAKSLRMLLFLMFDHVGGLNTLINCIAIGAHIVLPNDRNPLNVCSLIEKYKVQVLPTTPTFLNMMLMANVNDHYDLKSIRMITYGTESMPASLLNKLRKEFPKVKFLQTFGTSETGIANISSRSSSSLDIRFDDPNTEVKIVNGELWIRSKTQVLGYINADLSSFSSDGWFKTGDLVESTEDGYFKIMGRLKEVINVGGEKVLPSEIESIVLEIDFVNDCLVYPVLNSITGQSVGLQVVIHDVSKSDNELRKDIRKFCSLRMDKFKVPSKIEFVDKTNFGERFKKMRLKVE